MQLIVDTDPGIDDAIALIVLLAKKRKSVSAVLSSYGNISVAKTTKNAISVLKLCNCDIPVIMGTKMPDNANYVEAANIHGEDGLGGLNVTVAEGELGLQTAYEGDYLQKIYDTIIKEDVVDYIVLGPLTNLALLIKRFPSVLPHINKVVVMGGGFDMGNVTKDAEFNIHCDAKSADYVFKMVKNLSLVPLNTTTPVAFSLKEIENIKNISTSLSTACVKILTANYHNCVKYGEDGSTMHDATAVIYYLEPELFLTEKSDVNVKTDDAHYGKTEKANVENVAIATKCAKITIATHCDSQKIKDYITDCIKSY